MEGCKVTLPLINQSRNFAGTEKTKEWFLKCYFCDGVLFNEHKEGRGKSGVEPMCAFTGWEVYDGDDIE